MKIAHVSTFPPLRCGIASFVSDLIGALPNIENLKYSLHYGINNTTESSGAADISHADQLSALAKTISDSDCDLISLQHEFGIWGGNEGEYIFNFLDNVSKPIVSVLHTSFGPGVRSEAQRQIINRLVQQSRKVVLLTEIAKKTLETLLNREITHAAVIPHGVPDICYKSPDSLWDNREANCKPLRLVTPGFFREDKGLETILLALWRLKRQGRQVSYVIAGEPQHQFSGQRQYFSEIIRLIDDLDLTSMVNINSRYLSVAEQLSAIQDSHIGIFAYQDASHASSGTVPLVLCAGRPVICTPFEYAKAKRLEIPEVIVSNSFSATSLADALCKVMDDPDTYLNRSQSIYEQTRPWIWQQIGLRYIKEYHLAIQ